MDEITKKRIGLCEQGVLELEYNNIGEIVAFKQYSKARDFRGD